MIIQSNFPTKPKSTACFLVVLALVPTFCLSLYAQPGPSGSAKNWSVEFIPYVWLAGIGGEVATLPGLPPVEFNAGVGDVLSNLDAALMFTTRIQAGKVGVISDIVYAKLAADNPTPGPLFDDASFETKNFVGTFTGVYRAVDNNSAKLDLGAGIRVWNVDTELGFIGGQIGDRVIDSSESWVDPVLISSLRVPLTRRVSFNGIADIGGFGAGSEFTWQTYGGISFHFNDSISSVFGYRYLGVDYETNDFIYDIGQQGFLLGISFRF